jgi:hypothetical protein
MEVADMSDLVIISKHEKGFWQADFYKGGGEIPSADWDEIGPSPDDFFTLKLGQSALDAVRRAKEKWPGALINIPTLSQSKDKT